MVGSGSRHNLLRLSNQAAVTMVGLRLRAAVLGFAALLGGCSFANDALWPSLTGEEPASKGRGEAVQIRPSAAEANTQPTLTSTPPALGSNSFQPGGVTPGQSTGTFVGEKVAQLRTELGRLQGQIAQHNGELQRLRGQTAQNAQRYHSTLAAINARLQVGTTPGNPVLVNQWSQAQTELDAVAADTTQMSGLSNGVASDSTMAAYILESTRATYGLSGAVEEDHRQLAVLEDDVNRTVVLIDRLLNELAEDIRRQTNYVGNERHNLTTLALAVKNGELYGGSLANRAFATTAALPAPAPSVGRQDAARGTVDTRSPLVVIRFDRRNVDYEQAVYTAVSRALERRPDATFDLVGVAPNRGQAAANTNTARRNAEQVLRSLTEMGLPPSRVSLSSAVSQQAQTNEVHIYIR